MPYGLSGEPGRMRYVPNPLTQAFTLPGRKRERNQVCSGMHLTRKSRLWMHTSTRLRSWWKPGGGKMGSNHPLNHSEHIYRPVNLFLKGTLLLLSNISYITDMVTHYIWHFGNDVPRETSISPDRFRAPFTLWVSRETIRISGEDVTGLCFGI
jgi:hypothetical protein